MDKITPIPIGVEFFKEMITKGYHYIDKTLLIRDLLAQKNKVTLFTRPRRFGKTLSQSMLKTFFEKEILQDGTVADNSVYFQEKKIMEAGEEYTSHMGQYPVIFLSLKSAKQPTYEMAYGSLIDEIRKEYERHRYLLKDCNITEKTKEIYNSISNMEADKITSAKAIAFLSECLEKYHKKKTIILLDEYDVPLENAYFAGFYDEMVSFIRSLFESALKTNDSLEFAVVTGCLRISRESNVSANAETSEKRLQRFLEPSPSGDGLFTGLNNLKVVSVLDESYAEYFGFTQNEVDSFLEAYGIADKKDEVKNWYDGYLFANTEVYNPWSVINYVYDIVHKNTKFPKPYWSNTSSNSIVRELVENADEATRAELEEMIAGGTMEKPVHEDITYEDIHKSQDNLWNFLFFTGYLKSVEKNLIEQQIYLSMAIPNEEILYIYKNNIREWSSSCIEKQDLSGLEKGCMEALEQIEKLHYDNDIVEEGYTDILKYGICFYKKECQVMKLEQEPQF